MDYRIVVIALTAMACVIVGIVKLIGAVKGRQARKERREGVIQALVDRGRTDSAKWASSRVKEYSPLGQTTDEILSHDDEVNVLGALCYRIAEKEATRGESSLTDTERKLCAVYQLEGQVANGGFDQYFFNSTGATAEIALAGLKDMGSTAAAAILERAMAIFPGGKPPTDRQSRWKAMSRIASRSESVWEECDGEFYDKEEDTYRMCLAYARKKRAEILLP